MGVDGGYMQMLLDRRAGTENRDVDIRMGLTRSVIVVIV